MPRKSLMGSGESMRINFRVTDEVLDILEQISNKSTFIRDAIVFYWEKNEYLKNNLDDPRYKNNVKKNEETYNGTWSPPWKSS
ncbi:MAG: hypothetical protein ACXAEU_22515 [Candidatus Hodarchaeales archaeon]